MTGSLCLLPLLQVGRLHDAWATLNQGAGQARLKGLMFTAAVALLTLTADRLGWIWRT